MDFSKSELFSYQILQYLVTKYDYRVVRVEEHRNDIWLMNAKQEDYPVIRICSETNAKTLSESDYIRNVHRFILDIIQREGPIVILNTNPESVPITNEVMTQIRVVPDEISDENILATFSDLDSIVHESANIQEEMVQLTKDVEEAQMVHQSEIIEQLKERIKPKVTYMLMAFITLCSLGAILIQLYLGVENVGLIASGAFYKMNIIASHEYFRLLSAGFVHANIPSLLIHIFVLYIVGKSCERKFKKLPFITILFSSIIVGNVFELVMGTNTISLGLGAGIVGLLAAYITTLVENKSIRYSVIQVSLVMMVGTTCLLFFVDTISLVNYLGGLLTGIILSACFNSHEDMQSLRRHARIALTISIVLLCFVVSQVKSVGTLDPYLDADVVNNYRHTSLDFYATYLEKTYAQQYRLENTL